jgi:hypothetical protein
VAGRAVEIGDEVEVDSWSCLWFFPLRQRDKTVNATRGRAGRSVGWVSAERWVAPIAQHRPVLLALVNGNGANRHISSAYPIDAHWAYIHIHRRPLMVAAREVRYP